VYIAQNSVLNLLGKKLEMNNFESGLCMLLMGGVKGEFSRNCW